MADKSPTWEEGISRNDIFREIFDRIQTGIMIIDAETHAIVDINDDAEHLIGLSKDQIIGKTCHDFVCLAHCGECPITDQHNLFHSTERVLVSASGERIPVLKTVALATVKTRTYLIESFVDIRDQKKAEERMVALLAYLNESVLRVQKPLELTCQNLLSIEPEIGSGDYNAEEIRMQIQVQVANLNTMSATLKDLARQAAEGQKEIPDGFREFIVGK
ncbi:PAS domain S-box protein [Methanoregula sp. UBA64]|jgi:PAS domain S-box-containing protein|uniref:PAS domain S-box protein n=1 Tax=Methanoregula sp. UBA64 TaxID=1915554 RepID=UPI0025DEA53A|nr:PAS domain S-box protein [Methanoregula sp. UBA64]